jgi:hypothetical protein
MNKTTRAGREEEDKRNKYQHRDNQYPSAAQQAKKQKEKKEGKEGKEGEERREEGAKS